MNRRVLYLLFFLFLNVQNVNAKEKYESFFAKFFADNGEYLKFMSMKEKRVLSSKYSKTDAQTVCITTVCVDRIKLKEYLQENGILK